MHNHSPTIQCPQRSGESTSMLRILALACLILAFNSGCGEEQAPPPPKAHDFALEVIVADDDQNPVAKAPVLLDGNIIGYTDRDGTYQAALNEFAGTEVSVAVGPMDAYLVPDDAATTAVLKRVKTIDGVKNSPVRLQTTLESVRNDYLIWVDLDCAEEVDNAHCKDLPISFNGEVMAKTDAKGRAHFDFEGVPDQTVKLSIETPTYTPKEGDTSDDYFELTPANPSYDITLGLGAEVLTVTDTFTDPKAAARLAEDKKNRRAAARRRSRRRRKQKKKKQKEKAEKAGVIELF